MKIRVIEKKRKVGNRREGGKRKDEKIFVEKKDGNKTNRKSVVSEMIKKAKRAGEKGSINNIK